MQDHDIGRLQQVFQRDLAYPGGGVFLSGAAVGQYSAAEGVEELCGPSSDLSVTHDAHGLSLQLAPHKAILCASCPAAVFHGAYVAEDVQCHAQDQFGDGFVGIAGSVADSDPFFTGGRKAYMVDAGKGHVDKFKVTALPDDFVRHGHVGDDHGVRAFCLFNEGLYISGAGEAGKAMSRLLKGLFEHGQFLIRNAERFHYDDPAHIMIPFLLSTCILLLFRKEDLPAYKVYHAWYINKKQKTGI